MDTLEVKNIVITGGTGGLGFAIAERLMTSGANVVLADLPGADGEGALAALPQDKGRAIFVEMDVSDADDVERAAAEAEERLGPIDGVVANAGIAPPTDAFDYDAQSWRRTMGVNVDGVFFTAQSFAKRMKAAGRPGSIVMISSIAGFRVVKPERHAAYGTSKAAVAHLASLLGVEWAPHGIRVNALAPGYTATQILKKAQESDPEMMANWLSQVPIGRLLEPAEIANGVAFLLSDLASGVTATTLSVDGGYRPA
ncbi:2,5-dichloro-2,5-cyclohexadiene-1,4-diol dehydrogenase [Aquimixticola soesokkakensis]|uniref:2,5-dichloro-2,5-cyclohexadiene-1,4-diol dehydrogenase n=1 Tax=Aquimixticola soesokkakensis TaxID=1519096 RepID=A0A1Y5T1M6_9RHOB|nr:glucose 1-dehydrogenase [Aquimixticola soesokkakensis]SLN53927.1 2,5-dichloro-2,5-cyclohexadiene-1,4-diol dehydrogenase [Aquimixticola soesokkakensis]